MAQRFVLPASEYNGLERENKPDANEFSVVNLKPSFHLVSARMHTSTDLN